MNKYSNLRIIAILIVSLFVFGISGFMLIEDWSFTDSVYMTIITISTVGYKEVHELSIFGRWHIIILILASFGTVAYAVSYLTQKLLETKYFFRRKMERSIQKLEDHFIIAGYGRMGKRICSILHENNKKYVVIDKNGQSDESNNFRGEYFLEGDVTDDGILIKAGVSKAKGLVTVVDSVADNVYCTLTARSLNDSLFIVSRSVSENGTANLLRAGADKVINPYEAGGYAMAQILLKPSAIEFIELTTGNQKLGFIIDEIPIPDSSPLIGKSIKDSNIRDDYNILIAAIKDSHGSINFNPKSEVTLSKGDTLIAFGKLENINALDILK
ncbi:MAG: potassium channel protein [Candidatus Marinimicrobia bacterium]|nr:potassium channel protein [Candidatus Neomarinimicrobiota bacterium]